MNGKSTILHMIRLAALTLVLGLVVSSCSLDNLNWNPQGDWDYELCHDYYIMRVNKDRIDLCVKNNTHYEIIVDMYITEFCYNIDFIAVRRLEIGPEDKFDEITELDLEEADYYLVDARNGTVFGPYQEEDGFERVCQEQNVGDLGEWIDTYPDPKGAKY